MKILIKITRNNGDMWYGKPNQQVIDVPDNLTSEDIRGMPLRLGDIAEDILKKASVRKQSNTEGENGWQALEYELKKLVEIVCKLRVARGVRIIKKKWGD